MLGLAALAACASTAPAVHPDDLSAEQHRQEAAHERMRADDAYARYQPSARAPMDQPPQGAWYLDCS
jgi:hypothetical protein